MTTQKPRQQTCLKLVNGAICRLTLQLRGTQVTCTSRGRVKLVADVLRRSKLRQYRRGKPHRTAVPCPRSLTFALSHVLVCERRIGTGQRRHHQHRVVGGALLHP